MRFQLPASRKKHYLSGTDWMIHALDRASRKQFRCGNSFMIAVELSGPWDAAGFEEFFHRYCLNFPQLDGWVARDFNLAPYWRFSKYNRRRAAPFSFQTAQNRDEALHCLEAALNTPFERGGMPVKVSSVKTPAENFSGFIFDHRFFDARGAEMFLREFQIYFLSGGKESVPLIPPAPACLDRWDIQFEAGKKINRARIAREKDTELRCFKKSSVSKKAMNRFKVKSFTPAETRDIYQRCENQAGPFMFSLYSLAASVRAMHALFSLRGETRGDFIIPVTRDMRTGSGDSRDRLLFNHLSFLFFRVSPEEAAESSRLFQSLKIQFYEQTKNKLPEALSEAAMLTRIVPQVFLTGRISASFSFAFLGQSVYDHDRLGEARVENMIHMPRIPYPPGAGIFLSQSRGKLNVTLSYLDSLLNEEEAESVLQQAAAL